MPWHIEQDDDGAYCVVRDGDQHNEGCHETRAEAMDHMAALYAAEASEEAELLSDPAGTPFNIFVMVEGVETADGRMFEIGQVSARPLPLPLMLQDTNPEWGGHAGARFVGAITELDHDPRDPTRWVGRGRLAATAVGREAEAQIRAGLRGVSVDASADDVVYDVREVDTSGFPIDVLVRYSQATIMGATVTPFPAFEQCVIWFDDEPEPERVSTTHGTEIPRVDEPQVVDDGLPMLIAAGGGPLRPPAAWFEDPQLDGPTPLTVMPDGRIYGHIADWRTCHTGYPGACITAPHSPSGYAYFHTGEIVTAEGSRIAVGQITLATGHAADDLDYRATLAHYDDTGTAAADVRVGEDAHGIWCAGAVRPGLSDEQIRALCAAAPSGDWRQVNGYLELVAILQVNVPGFPIPRPHARLVASAAGWVQRSLVAAPAPRRARFGPIDPVVLRRLERVERQLAVLRPQVLAGLAARVHGRDR